jgi:hypothetical protein
VSERDPQIAGQGTPDATQAVRIVDAWRLADLITRMGGQEIPKNCSAIQRELLLSFVRLMAIRIRLSAAEEAFGTRATGDVSAEVHRVAMAAGTITGGDEDVDQARAVIVNSMAALAIRSGADVGAVGHWMAGVVDPHEGLADLAAIVRAGQAADRRASNEDGGSKR